MTLHTMDVGMYHGSESRVCSHHAIRRCPKEARRGEEKTRSRTPSQRHVTVSGPKSSNSLFQSYPISFSTTLPFLKLRESQTPRSQRLDLGTGTFGLLDDVRSITDSPSKISKFACHVDTHRMNFVPANEQKRFGEVWRNMHRLRHNQDD